MDNIAQNEKFMAQSAPPGQSSIEDKLVHIKGDGFDVYVGAETAKFYSRDQVEALGKHAGRPVLFLSKDDLKMLNSRDTDEIAKELKSWLPEDKFQKVDILDIYEHMFDGKPNMSFSIIKNELQAGVGVIPGSDFGIQDFLRGDRYKNFPDAPFNKSLSKEMALWAAAHEATHLKLEGEGKKVNGDINADAGAHNFVEEHLEWFATLKDPKKEQSIMSGMRALKYWLSGPDPSEPDVHDGTAFYSPGRKNDKDLRGDEQIFAASREAVVGKVAEELAKRGVHFATPRDFTRDVSLMMIDSIEHPSAKTANQKFDPREVLKRYLAKRGIDSFENDKTSSSLNDLRLTRRGFDSQNHKALWALNEFRDNLVSLAFEEKNSPRYRNAREFFQANSISETDALEFGRQCEIRNSSEHLQEMLRKKVLDPVILDRFMAALESLQSTGAFVNSPDQENFANNLVAGSSFYVNQNALREARAWMEATDPPKEVPEAVPSKQPKQQEQNIGASHNNEEGGVNASNLPLKGNKSNLHALKSTALIAASSPKTGHTNTKSVTNQTSPPRLPLQIIRMGL